MIEKKFLTRTECGKDIVAYTIMNASGASVTLCNIGAAIISVNVPDRDGKLADVVLGYSDPLSYFGDGPCMGKVPGRYANRIAKGKFILDGKEYLFEGEVRGKILRAPDGEGGFGYDPVFFINEANMISAELPEGDKDIYSHRGKAARLMKMLLDKEEGYGKERTEN